MRLPRLPELDLLKLSLGSFVGLMENPGETDDFLSHEERMVNQYKNRPLYGGRSFETWRDSLGILNPLHQVF